MKTFILSAFSFILMLTPIIGNAQEETDFQKFLVQTFEVNLSNLDQGNNNAPFLKAFGEKLVWTNAIVSIDGSVTERSRSKADLKQELTKLGREHGLSVKWDILQYNELTARENTRIASFDVNVLLQANGATISKGKNVVQVIAKKMDGFYVITYLSVLQVSDKLYIGPCYVNIKETSPTSFATATAFPAGTEYDVIEKEFSFLETKTAQVVKIKGVEQNYFWNPKSNAITLNNDGSIKIGSAENKNGVILMVIKHQSGKKCTKMIKTNKAM